MGVITFLQMKTMTNVIRFMSNYVPNLVCNYYFILKARVLDSSAFFDFKILPNITKRVVVI